MNESKEAAVILDGIEGIVEEFKAENIPFDRNQANELYDWIVELDESDELIESYPEVKKRIREVFTQE